MRIRILLLIFTLLTYLPVYSQKLYSVDDNNDYINKVLTRIDSTKSDSVRAILNYRVSLLYLKKSDIEKYNYHLAKGDVYKKTIPFINDVSIYYHSYEHINTDIDKFESELDKANKALKKYKNKEAYRLRAIILQNYGLIQQWKGKENDFMDILINQAIPLAKKTNDYEIIGGLYRGVATALGNNHELEKANEYYKQAEYYVDKIDREQTPTAIESQIETYLFYADNLLEAGRIEEGKSKLKKAEEIKKNFPVSNYEMLFFHINGLVKYKEKRYNEALDFFNKALLSSKKNNNAFWTSRVEFYLSDVYLKKGNFKKAKVMMEKILPLTPYPVEKKQLLTNLAEIYKKEGEFKKAYEYMNSYAILNDSLNKSMYQEEIIQLEAKFNKVENEGKIKLLEAQKERSNAELKNSRVRMIFFGVISFLLLIVLLLVLIFYRYQKKLSLQKEINYKQELEHLENKQQLVVSNALLEGQELERERVARELHDGLGSLLSALKMNLQREVQNHEFQNNQIFSVLDESIAELKSISHDLMPSTLLNLGLESALRDLCGSFNNSDLIIDFEFLANEFSLTKNKKIVVYRIIQELLNNALKYSKATKILVSCTSNDSFFYITVEDNGLGFNMDNVKKGMGLTNVKNRVKFLGGKYEIDSKEEIGTSVYIEFDNKLK